MKKRKVRLKIKMKKRGMKWRKVVMMFQAVTMTSALMLIPLKRDLTGMIKKER